MKTVLIIRHAKSDQGFPGNDFERPLNDRGRRDAPEMAARLLEKKISINAFVSSPATRALTTAKMFCKTYNKTEADIILVSSLYHAGSPVFFDVISQLPDHLHTVALFSHNPGITHFVNDLHSGAEVDNMPTCGIFVAEADITGWKEFARAKKRFLFFDYPKNR